MNKKYLKWLFILLIIAFFVILYLWFMTYFAEKQNSLWESAIKIENDSLAKQEELGSIIEFSNKILFHRKLYKIFLIIIPIFIMVSGYLLSSSSKEDK